MRKIFIVGIILFSLSSFVKPLNTNYWGFFGHKKINNLAVFTLPEPLFGFFRVHQKEITERSVAPDKRRHMFKDEAPKHYIDLDHYCDSREAVFDSMPEKWNDAVAKYTKDTLLAFGIVPWAVNLSFYQLKKAFENENWEKVVKISADLGHYIADAHVPLHTTENYNGQMTGQDGIHGFWESRLPELFFDEYDFFIGKAQYVNHTQHYIWERLKESHWALDSVLEFEKYLRTDENTVNMYSFELKGKRVVKCYAEDYAKQYHIMLDGMVERRMKSAVKTVGSFWYTAWVMAGQPNLPKPESLLILAEDTTLRKHIRNKASRIHE
ncbi:MAG: hypothetical protein ACJAUV_001774 [Flavobacteriales bacterium]|jgi:hypothetical protein